MKRRYEDLRLQQTDEMLSQCQDKHLPTRPTLGWARSIREALGMSGVAFARRLGMTPAGASKLEKAEAQDAITLGSLRKLALALDCELQYALIPRTSLKQQLDDRAMELARVSLKPISHSMSLEDQSVQEFQSQLQLNLIAKEILNGPRRELW